MHSGDAASRKVSCLGLLALVDPYKSSQARIASEQSSTDKGVGEIHASDLSTETGATREEVVAALSFPSLV